MTTERTPQHTIVVGTAGHIDHGKTVLVRALTGVDTDRLPEEKRRGITVDLGFARCDLESSSGDRLSLDIIDVPGHRQFVRNMLAGVGGIDFVMLVISAAEGIMPQTEEHLAICGLLGIRRGLVVLTKADLVTEEELGFVCEEVRSAMRDSFLKDADIVPVSVHSGLGMPALRSLLTRICEQTPVRNRAGLPRLPIDRAFVMKGFGTVVTGTLQSGSLCCRQGCWTGQQRCQRRLHPALQGQRFAVGRIARSHPADRRCHPCSTGAAPCGGRNQPGVRRDSGMKRAP
jgi:selenocysteine-specific elongation factor